MPAVRESEGRVFFEGATGLFRGLPPAFAAGFTCGDLARAGAPAGRAAASLAAALGAPAAEVARLRQVHGRAVLILEEKPGAGGDLVAGEGDAALTREPGRLLVVASADCVPILLADPATGWIAAVHAGWRGTALRILDAVLEELGIRGVDAANLFAAFGPSISQDRYEVGPEVLKKMSEAYEGVPVDPSATVKGHGDRTLLDVAAFNRALLLRRGVPAANVREAGLCTFDGADLFPSWRRDGPGTGRILTGIVRI
jgi:YfiH family protein